MYVATSTKLVCYIHTQQTCSTEKDKSTYSEESFHGKGRHAPRKLYCNSCVEALRNLRKFSRNLLDFVKFLVTCTVFREWKEHVSLHALHKMLSHPHLSILEWPIPTINQWCQDCRCNNFIVLSSHLLHYLAHITAKNCFRYTQEMSKSSLGSAINVLLKTIIKIYSVLGTTHSGHHNPVLCVLRLHEHMADYQQGVCQSSFFMVGNCSHIRLWTYIIHMVVGETLSCRKHFLLFKTEWLPSHADPYCSHRACGRLTTICCFIAF